MPAIYISKEQSQLVRAEIKKLADAYDIKRGPAPTPYGHKFMAEAFIDTSIIVKFEKGVPTQLIRGELQLGSCSLERTSPDDVKYNIPLAEQFERFRQSQKDFVMKLYKSGDGCCTTESAVAYDTWGRQLADFSDTY
jgi:hypothetical protein